MSSYAIVLAAGLGQRMGSERPKQFLSLAGRPMLAYTLEAFERAESIDRVVLVVPTDWVAWCEKLFKKDMEFQKVEKIVAGGTERQESVSVGLDTIRDCANLIAIHDGVRALVLPEQIDAVVMAAKRFGAAVLGTPAVDTVKEVDGEFVSETLDRSRLWFVQTPQAFRADLIRQGHWEAKTNLHLATDDAGLIERLNVPIKVIEGRRDNLKMTTPDDLEIGEAILKRRSRKPSFRIGQGYDVHRLIEGRPLVLGGVTIPFERGLQGHSDADVLSHAIADAILGGLGLGDIGRHFPDTDQHYFGISSLILLKHVAELVAEARTEVLNIDATVMAEFPKLAPYIPKMQICIGEALNLPSGRVSVKATTAEGLGFVGTGEGMAAQAIALIGMESN